MELKEQKGAGLSLIVGSLLMIVTMVLHPVGGDFNHLVKIFTMGKIAHGIAILSLPFVTYGFWGLTRRLKGEPFLSNVGFTIILFGLIAAMLAAATNGFVLMDFVQSYKDTSQDTIDSLQPFFVFMRKFNHAFDFIFIGGICLSILFWSVAIIKSKALNVWIGYFGAILSTLGIVLFVSGYELIHLVEFRIFVCGNAAWILCTGIFLRRE